jgi:hypothetical protein
MLNKTLQVNQSFPNYAMQRSALVVTPLAGNAGGNPIASREGLIYPRP